MALSVDARNPQFRVRVVSQRSGDVRFEDLRPAVLEFSTHRQIGQAAGTFQITLLPTPPKGYGQKWTDIIKPMDYVEVWAWVPPRAPRVPLMRGFVDRVGEVFNIESGAPEHRIVIAGRDYGKLALCTKLYYPHGEVQNIELLKAWQSGIDEITGYGTDRPNPEQDPAGETSKQIAWFSPSKILGVIFDKFLVPQQDLVLSTFGGLGAMLPRATFAAETDSWEDKLRVFNPALNVQNWHPFTDLWTLFRTYQHSPWRELFFEDTETGPRLLYRPTPWYDASGSRVQEFTASVVSVPVTRNDIVSFESFADDEEVQNFFFTLPADMSGYASLPTTFGSALEGVHILPFQGNPYLVGFDDKNNEAKAFGVVPDERFRESAYQRFGFRISRVQTPYLDVDDGVGATGIEKQLADIRRQGLEGNLRLARALGHNDSLRHGSYTLKGDERLRLGCYLQFDDGSLAYAASVSQRFRQGTTEHDGRFTTSIGFTRGMGASRDVQ